MESKPSDLDSIDLVDLYCVSRHQNIIYLIEKVVLKDSE